MANRKRNKQLETGGLVIMRALYGNQKILDNLRSNETSFESTSEIIDVTIPMNFLVNDSGQLKVCFLYFIFNSCSHQFTNILDNFLIMKILILINFFFLHIHMNKNGAVN